MEMKSRRIPNVGLHNSWERTESCQKLATQEQVDAYIRSLDSQALLNDISTPSHYAEKYRAAGGAVGHLRSRAFFWGLIALALGCFAWLLEVIYEGLK